MTMTRDQELAARWIMGHDYSSGPLAVCGYAGTGKSWLATHVVPEVFAGRRLVYAAPTNKAARKVLWEKLEDAGVAVSGFPHGRGRHSGDDDGGEDGDRFTEPVSLGTVFALLNLPKVQLVCDSSGIACGEGETCPDHQGLMMTRPDGVAVPAGPCMLRESGLKADPRTDPLSGAEVIIIDEASMLSRDDYATLCQECARRRIPLLLFGDPGQLPPVGDPGFSALAAPGIVMEAIVRQRAGDPIIALATMARLGQYLAPGPYGPLAHVLPPDLGESVSAANTYFAQRAASGDMIICPRHDGYRPGGRVWHNNRAREALGFTGPWPVPGDVVVSMANDYYLWRAFNGSRGTVLEAGEPFEHAEELVIDMTVQFSGYRDPRRFLALARQFGHPGNGTPAGPRKVQATVPVRPAFRDELEAVRASRPDDLTPKELKMLHDGKEPLLRLDYGYALTAWKAQGDEARGVLVTGAFDRLPHVSREAYLYTAITRAREEIAIG